MVRASARERRKPAPLFDSMFNADSATRDATLRRAADWIETLPRSGGKVVLVTHDVNIQALAHQVVRQGEMMVAKVREDGVLEVVGTWRP